MDANVEKENILDDANTGLENLINDILDEDKKGNINYSMSVLGSGISAEVYFTLPKGGRNCNATVDSNFSNCHITFSGELHPYNTRVTMGKKIP